MLAAGAAVLAASACGGSGSDATTSFAHESAKPASRILSDARSVVAAATSVHLSGRVGGSSAVAVDLHLSRTGGSGRVSASGLAFKVTRIGRAAGSYTGLTDMTGFSPSCGTRPGASPSSARTPSAASA